MSIQHHDVEGTTESTSTPQPENKKISLMDRLVRFLREVQVEMKKTDWPTRDELTKFTIVVIVVMVVVSIFLFVADRGAYFMSTKLFGV